MNYTLKNKILAFCILLGLVASFFLYKNLSDKSVTDFESCKNRGYPILETFPEQCKTPDGRTFRNDAQSIDPQPVATSTPGSTVGIEETDVKIYTISRNQVISSPLTINGEARLWYFEGSFPVELIDGNGKRLAIAPATAQGDWMTTSFVPFKLTLTFAQPTTSTGTLIFRNDNPSGLPENEKSFRVPVKFKQSERTVQLYYYDSNKDKDQNGIILCGAKGLVPVNRSIPVTQTPLQDTLRLFLQGALTSSEKTLGITTDYPLSGVILQGASISPQGVATLNLSDPLKTTSGGSCKASVLQAQLEATAKQFKEVKSVQYTNPVFQP